MWEALIPWFKAISFLIAFIHVLFHFEFFLANVSKTIIHMTGHIYMNHPLSIIRLIIVIIMYIISCL